MPLYIIAALAFVALVALVACSALIGVIYDGVVAVALAVPHAYATNIGVFFVLSAIPLAIAIAFNVRQWQLRDDVEVVTWANSWKCVYQAIPACKKMALYGAGSVALSIGVIYPLFSHMLAYEVTGTATAAIVFTTALASAVATVIFAANCAWWMGQGVRGAMAGVAYEKAREERLRRNGQVV